MFFWKSSWSGLSVWPANIRDALQEMNWRHTFQPKALLRIKDASYVLPNRLIASNQNNNFSYITNFTASINVWSDGALTRWSAQYWHEYETGEGIVDFTVAWIFTFFTMEDSKLHMLKWSWDDTRVLRHFTLYIVNYHTDHERAPCNKLSIQKKTLSTTITLPKHQRSLSEVILSYTEL